MSLKSSIDAVFGADVPLVADSGAIDFDLCTIWVLIFWSYLTDYWSVAYFVKKILWYVFKLDDIESISDFHSFT